MFAALDLMENQVYGAGRPFLRAFNHGPLAEMGPNPNTLLNYQLANVAIDTFRERPGAGGHVTTSERISHMVADFNQDTLDHIATGVQDDQRINLPINDYIEAQVYGGVDLASDVAEIRYIAQDTSKMRSAEKDAYLDSVEGLNQMAREMGVRVVEHQPADVERTNL